MKLKHWISIVLCAVVSTQCSNTNPPINEDGYTAPPLPNEWNTFKTVSINLFTTLENKPIFDKIATDIIKDKIATTGGYIYLIDRADVAWTKPVMTNPTTSIAQSLKKTALFSPYKFNENGMEGCGIIVHQLIKSTSAHKIENGLVLSGPTLEISGSPNYWMDLNTIKLTNTSQFEPLNEILKSNLSSQKLIVGTISNEIKNEFEKYLKYNLTLFRLSFANNTSIGCSESIFVLSSLNWGLRHTKEIALGNNTNMYTLEIESFIN